MKSYLCIEDSAPVVQVQGISGKERDALYFVVKAKNWKEVNKKAKEMGAKAVRVLTPKETATESKDGAYDIEL